MYIIVATHESDGQFCCAACAESSGATDARRLAPCTDNPMPCDRSLSYIHASSDARNQKQSVGLGADGSFWLLDWSYIVDIYIYRERDSRRIVDMQRSPMLFLYCDPG